MLWITNPQFFHGFYARKYPVLAYLATQSTPQIYASSTGKGVLLCVFQSFDGSQRL